MSNKNRDKPRKMIFNFISAVLILYLLMLAGLYMAQRNLMYFPDTSRPSPEDFGVTDYIAADVKTADSLSLSGWYFPPSKPGHPVIVMFHGNAGHIGYRAFKAPLYQAEGYGVLLAEYRGYGGNTGKMSEQGAYNDARAYIEWLHTAHNIAYEDMILHGESLGTGVAIQMATEYPVRAVILEAAYSTLSEIAGATYFFVPVALLMRDQYRSIDKIQNVTAPILFIHGTKDAIVPLSSGRALYDKATAQKAFVEIPEAGHNDLYNYGVPLHVIEFLSNITKTDN
jgi:fermentation-respiration switch protein FrsA (DUF1100 family)